MDKRKAKIIFNKGGSGGLSPRVTLPITWLREMGVNPDNREVNVYEVAGEIIISKEEWKMTTDKIYGIVLKEIEKDIKNSWIDNSDNTYYIYDLIFKAVEMFEDEFEEDETAQDVYDEISTEVSDKIVEYLVENYKWVSKTATNGDVTVYYFDNCFNFKTVEELEKYFLIGE